MSDPRHGDEATDRQLGTYAMIAGNGGRRPEVHVDGCTIVFQLSAPIH